MLGFDPDLLDATSPTWSANTLCDSGFVDWVKINATDIEAIIKVPVPKNFGASPCAFVGSLLRHYGIRTSMIGQKRVDGRPVRTYGPDTEWLHQLRWWLRLRQVCVRDHEVLHNHKVWKASPSGFGIVPA